MIPAATDNHAARLSAEPLRSPLLEDLLASLRRRERLVVLDLGPARSRTIAFFSEGRHRLLIADAADALCQEGTTDTPSPAIADMLPDLGREPLDLILCWDLPNYLPRQGLIDLLDTIAPACSAATRIHCMVAYSTPRIPARPGIHSILPDASISRQQQGEDTIPAPRYPLADMDRVLPGFIAERSVLLRNGFQESLIRRRNG